MIIEHNSELKAMRVLARQWYRDFSTYSLSSESGISPPMAYKFIKKLSSKNILSFTGKSFRLNFSNPFSFAFKMAYDAERVLELSDYDQRKINHVFWALSKEYANDLCSFAIFGSTASHEQTEKSDIDMLAVVSKKKDIDYRKKGILGLGNINVIEKDKELLEKEYLKGNELVLNVLMNGILLFDNGTIRQLLQNPLPSPSLNSILEKKQRLDVLKERLLELAREKSHKELAEKLKLFIIEKARIIMLEKGIVPRSKKHIIDSMKWVSKSLHNDYIAVKENNAMEVIVKYV